MTSTNWDLEKEFIDISGNCIKVLQRDIDKLKEAKDNELIPFFHEPSLFQISYKDNCDEVKVDRAVGVLSDFEINGNVLIVSATQEQTKSISEWKIIDFSKARMTVWRVNETLDTLQVNIIGKESKFYMQTGGAMINHIFQTNLSAETPTPDIVAAEKIFSKNAIAFL